MPKGSIKIEGLEGVELTQKQKIFCEEYCRNGWNATKAALFAGYSEDTAYSIGNENLSKPEIKAYVDLIKNDYEKLLGINKAKVIAEHQKIAYSSMADFRSDWITRKEFNELTPEQKACIAEIDTKIRTEYEYDPDTEKKEPIGVEYVRIKLYDKQKALESIAKLMGYDAPVKLDVNANVDVQMYLPENGRETADK
jgi:phage terminase small subunit